MRVGLVGFRSRVLFPGSCERRAKAWSIAAVLGVDYIVHLLRSGYLSRPNALLVVASEQDLHALIRLNAEIATGMIDHPLQIRQLFEWHPLNLYWTSSSRPE
jgi:hypothetical protein